MIFLRFLTPLLLLSSLFAGLQRAVAADYCEAKILLSKEDELRSLRIFSFLSKDFGLVQWQSGVTDFLGMEDAQREVRAEARASFRIPNQLKPLLITAAELPPLIAFQNTRGHLVILDPVRGPTRLFQFDFNDADQLHWLFMSQERSAEGALLLNIVTEKGELLNFDLNRLLDKWERREKDDFSPERDLLRLSQEDLFREAILVPIYHSGLAPKHLLTESLPPIKALKGLEISLKHWKNLARLPLSGYGSLTFGDSADLLLSQGGLLFRVIAFATARTASLALNPFRDHQDIQRALPLTVANGKRHFLALENTLGQVTLVDYDSWTSFAPPTGLLTPYNQAMSPEKTTLLAGASSSRKNQFLILTMVPKDPNSPDKEKWFRLDFQNDAWNLRPLDSPLQKAGNMVTKNFLGSRGESFYYSAKSQGFEEGRTREEYLYRVEFPSK